MSEHLIVINPSDFERLVTEIKAKLTEEFSKISGSLIETPISTKEAAKMLNIGRATLSTWITEGTIPEELVHKIRNRHYFYPSELNQFIKGKRK